MKSVLKDLHSEVHSRCDQNANYNSKALGAFFQCSCRGLHYKHIYFPGDYAFMASGMMKTRKIEDISGWDDQ